MQFDRRSLLIGGLAAGIVTPGPSARLRAQPAPAAAHTFTIGEAKITVISDGYLEMPPAFVLPGRDTRDIEAAYTAAGQTFAGFRADVNVTVVSLGGETILIDAGSGPDFMPTVGRLGERLDAAGIKPESVTRVIFTHGHADHFWGIIDPLSNDTAFEAARHIMSEAERDYLLAPDVADKVPEQFRGMAAGTQRRLKALASRVTTVKPGAEIVTGVEIVDTGGHTPGHISVLITSGGQKLLVGGDVLNHAIIAFAEPGWRWGSDMDSDRAVATRRRILDRLATERIDLLGTHLPWPGRGRVERKDQAFRFLLA